MEERRMSKNVTLYPSQPKSAVESGTSATILYGFSRDLATGCWVVTTYAVPENALAGCFRYREEPRHMIGALAKLETDVFARDTNR